MLKCSDDPDDLAAKNQKKSLEARIIIYEALHRYCVKIGEKHHISADQVDAIMTFLNVQICDFGEVYCGNIIDTTYSCRYPGEFLPDILKCPGCKWREICSVFGLCK